MNLKLQGKAEEFSRTSVPNQSPEIKRSVTSLEPLITAPLSSSDGTGLILAGTENGETPRNTIHHET